ncbi:MAG TPA: CBS domain-containing protein [Acidobacteriota bacterium]|nr:CBS domain-containing protein [Acidobacteriota bacterium]
MPTVAEVMTTNPFSITMDTSLGDAMNVCSDKRIRHLPVVNEQGILTGLVTDRDLRQFISPRIGTISENNTDREWLKRPVHLMMVRQAVFTGPDASLSEAASLMLMHRIGCLPVCDAEKRMVGIITNTDLIRYIAEQT